MTIIIPNTFQDKISTAALSDLDDNFTALANQLAEAILNGNIGPDILQFRRDTASGWTASNYLLAAGELGIETDSNKFKIGNGSSTWNSLAYGGLQGVQGASGIQGTQGASGPQGPTGGASGLTGATGINGASGATGFQGSTGPTGSQGPIGSTGATGTQGASGIFGATGLQGASGPIGASGATGTQGASGVGATGARGSTGVQGASGATGIQGASGVGATGASGIQGINGASGATGATGTQGASGIFGATGLQGATGPDTVVANVLYVSKSGNDSNNGTTLAKSFLTIKAAAAVATSGTTIFVKSGDYTEDNPIQLEARVTVVGDNLRSVTVRPANTTSDIFYVKLGCYITGITFRDHTDGAAAFAFNPNGNAGFISTSPYIQNCSSITTTGKGMYIDGSKVSGLKSMVTDSYTQFNSGGMGIHIDNGGYAQLVSIFTICCDVGILCSNGSSCSITNSNTSFGTYGLKSIGKGPLIQTGSTNGVNQTGIVIRVNELTYQPNVNDALTFDDGTTYYSVDFVTEISPTEYDITLVEGIILPIADNTSVKFYTRSLISASGHTFEYVGTGNDLLTALPSTGAVPIQINEIVQEDSGKVFFTSTDQKGDFRIGADLVINQADGTITGQTFTKSLFTVMTPYILAIEGS
jgi:hypothetical protein